MRVKTPTRTVMLICFVFLFVFRHNALAAPETGIEVAWGLILSGLHSPNSDERVAAVRVLGLLSNDHDASDLAEGALADKKSAVRSAAATALGQMRSTGSIPKLKQVLDDKEISVVLAAARALDEMKDPEGYEIYYEILTGERKSSAGFIAQQTAILHDPKKLAQMGFEQGIGFIPYAGMGWDAVQVILKNDSSPIRAAAASMLANDPDPDTAKALVKAVRDNNWIVRVAAIEAIAKRGDGSLRISIEPSMYDPKREVRYTAAATVVHLVDVVKARQTGEQSANQP